MEDEGNFEGHTVDMDIWVRSLARILEDVPQYMCSQGHPGRIPQTIRDVDVKAYEPCFLPIGPYHHGKPRLQKGQKRKLIILKCFLEHKSKFTLKDYLKEIQSIEPAARSFYSDVEMESEEFVRMLLLDSLYIVTMFCGMPKDQERINQANTRTNSRVDNEDTNERVNQINEGTSDDNENTQMMARTDESEDEMRRGENMIETWFFPLFMHDLFLLENQLPFFILQKIYDLAYGGSKTQLISIMKDKVGMLLSDYSKLDSEMVISPTEEVHHLLHLCHMFFRPTLQQESTCQFPESSQMFRLGSAIQLYEAGVSFEARSGSTQYCLLDITVGSSGKMVMPSLRVEDGTISLLRNRADEVSQSGTSCLRICCAFASPCHSS